MMNQIQFGFTVKFKKLYFDMQMMLKLNVQLPWVTEIKFLLTISSRQVMRVKKNVN